MYHKVMRSVALVGFICFSDWVMSMQTCSHCGAEYEDYHDCSQVRRKLTEHVSEELIAGAAVDPAFHLLQVTEDRVWAKFLQGDAGKKKREQANRLFRDIDAEYQKYQEIKDALQGVIINYDKQGGHNNTSAIMLASCMKLLLKIYHQEVIQQIAEMYIGGTISLQDGSHVNSRDFAIKIFKKMHYQLAKIVELLLMMKNELGAITQGKIPTKSLCVKLLLDYQKIAAHASMEGVQEEINEIATMLLKPLVKLEFQSADVFDGNSHGKKCFKKTKALKIDSRFNPDEKLGILLMSYFLAMRDEYGLHFLVTLEMATAMDAFFKQYGIKEAIDAFSGLAMFKAAMVGCGSRVNIVSLDNCSEHPEFKQFSEGGKCAFFPEYDPEGVIVTEDSYRYLSEHRELIKSNHCLLLFFPGPQEECIKALRGILMLWGLNNGGMVILLSEAQDEKELFGEVFEKGVFNKRTVGNAELPEDLMSTIPYVIPRIFYIDVHRAN